MNGNEYTYDGSNNNELKAEGDYEVIVEKMEIRVLKTGTEKIYLQYRIRDDVEQKYKNACCFEDIWHEKENPKIFNRKRINQLLGTQHPEEGTVFKDINEVFNFMLGKRLIVHLVQEFDDYKGENVERVKYYKSTNYPIQQVGQAPKPKQEAKPTTPIVTDDDLPF